MIHTLTVSSVIHRGTAMRSATSNWATEDEATAVAVAASEEGVVDASAVPYTPVMASPAMTPLEVGVLILVLAATTADSATKIASAPPAFMTACKGERWP